MKILIVILTIILSILSVQKNLAQTEGRFIDSRDGKRYKTITYETTTNEETYSVTWMAENLNFYTANSFCANDSTSNCDKYGRLYTWLDAKEACPLGWHLPSDKEWTQLANFYGGLNDAGKHLKSKGKNKGSNKSSFNGLLGGMRDPTNGIYYKLGVAGFFWSSTESPNNLDEAYDWSFASWSDKLRHWEGGKLIGNSCRCIKG